MMAIFRVGFLVAAGLITASLPVCAQAPVITRDLPSGMIVLVGCRTTFVIEVEGDEPLTYAWFRDGQPISDATSPVFTIPYTTLADNGAVFYVTVSNGAGSVQSRSCALYIVLDEVPPTVTGARTGNNLQEVVVSFSAGGCGSSTGMDAASVSDPYNYSFGNDLEIFSAQFIPPGTVVLTTSTQVVGHVYSLAIGEVSDASGNVLRPTTVSFTASPVASPAPQFRWVRQIPGGDDDGGYGMALDAAGNAYVTTYLRTNATLGGVNIPGPGIVVAAYDSAGNVVRAFKGSDRQASSESLAIDAIGNIFVAGRYIGTATFGQTQLNNSLPFGGKAFLAKYSPTGAVLWARAVQESASATAGAAATDAQGNAYVTGSRGYADPATFVTKHDPQGNEVWTRTVTGTNVGQAITVDHGTNCIVAGYFRYAARFGNVTISSRGEVGAFIAKYDRDGTLQWARAEGGDGIWNNVYGVAVDQTGNICATGYYSGVGAFGSSVAPAGADMFVAKYDPAGHRLWVRTGGGRFNDIGFSIAMDTAGSCYVAGIFQGAASFGPFVFSNSGGENLEEAFVAKLDTNGEWLWAKQAGGARDDYAYTMAVNPGGGCFVAGFFRSPAYFDAYSLTTDSEIGDSFISFIAPQQPTLQITRAADGLEVDWPIWASNFHLEGANSLDSWSPLTADIQTMTNRVRAKITSKGTQRFFRLTAP